MSDLDAQRVLDGLSDAVIAANAAGTIVYANVAFERLLGWSARELSGQPLTRIIPARMRPAHEEGFARYLRTGEGRVFGKPLRVPALRRDGEEIHVELTLAAIDTALVGSADAPMFVASLRDVSDRVALEREVAAQRRLIGQHSVMASILDAKTMEEARHTILRTLAETFRWEVGLFWGVDRDTRTLKLAASWSENRVKADEVVGSIDRRRLRLGEGMAGRTWQTMEPSWTSDLDGERRPLHSVAADTLGLRAALCIPLRCASESHGVLEFLTSQSEQPDEEFLWAMAILGFQIGQFLERLQYEEWLRSSEEWLATTLRSIGDAVIATDENGNVRFLNPVAERLVGRTSADAVGLPLDDVFEIVDVRTREPLPSPVAGVLRERGAVGPATQALLLARDGSERMIEDSAAPISTADGVFRGVVICFQDITERKRYENTLHAAISSRDEFMSIASHELRTPLTALDIQLDGLRRGFEREPTVESQGKLLQKVVRAVRQVDRLTALVAQLLDVSRLSLGKLPLEFEEFDLAELSGEVLERFEEEALKTGATLTMTPSDPIRGRWDRTRMDQVLTNLVGNAIKYGLGKPVVVSLTADEARVVVAIRDEGIGVSQADLSRIFARFERAAPSNHYGGFGLGLYITKQIVEAHRGHVDAESEPGRGTTFTISLPRWVELHGESR